MIAKAHIKIEQGEPPVRSRTVADGPGTPRHGNLTALISLGIPKLVRFAKIRPRQPDTVHMVLLCLGRRQRAAFRRAESNSRMARLCQRGACLGDSNASSSQPGF
jgi:hypothetical protein